MYEEIVDALTKANAVDEASGLSIEKLMELTGRNLTTVVMSTLRLRQKGKAEVSNASILSDEGRHVWPAPRPGKMDITGEELAQTQREWKEQNHYPITVWIGPVLLNEIEARRKEEEDRELLRTFASRPTVHVGGDNYGQVAVGTGNKQEQQATTQSLRDSESSNPLIQNPIMTNAKKRTHWLETVAWIAGIIACALLAWQIFGPDK